MIPNSRQYTPFSLFLRLLRHLLHVRSIAPPFRPQLFRSCSIQGTSIAAHIFSFLPLATAQHCFQSIASADPRVATLILCTSARGWSMQFQCQSVPCLISSSRSFALAGPICAVPLHTLLRHCFSCQNRSPAYRVPAIRCRRRSAPCCSPAAPLTPALILCHSPLVLAHPVRSALSPRHAHAGHSALRLSIAMPFSSVPGLATAYRSFALPLPFVSQLGSALAVPGYSAAYHIQATLRRCRAHRTRLFRCWSLRCPSSALPSFAVPSQFRATPSHLSAFPSVPHLCRPFLRSSAAIRIPAFRCLCVANLTSPRCAAAVHLTPVPS